MNLINILTMIILTISSPQGQGNHENQLSHYWDDSGNIHLTIDNLSPEFLEFDPESIRIHRNDSYSFRGYLRGDDGGIESIIILYDDLDIWETLE